VPSCSAAELRGLRAAELADFGAVQTNVTERGEGHVALTFTEIKPTGEPNSDAALLASGWATITALRPVCEADDHDLKTLTTDAASPTNVHLRDQ
jgi:5'-nucleotidase